MDECDVQSQIRDKETTLMPGPVMATIKSNYRGKVIVVEEPLLKKATPSEKRQLDAAWKRRVAAKRALDDNRDTHQSTSLKKEYLAALCNYKQVYKRIYGEQ